MAADALCGAGSEGLIESLVWSWASRWRSHTSA